MTPHTLFSKPACLPDATLDVLILASHRLDDDTYTTAVGHLRGCTACRSRCVIRAQHIAAREQFGVLQSAGWQSASSGGTALPPSPFSSVAAGFTAVGILGVALLSPLFFPHAREAPARRHTATPALQSNPDNETEQQRNLRLIEAQTRVLETKLRTTTQGMKMLRDALEQSQAMEKKSLADYSGDAQKYADTKQHWANIRTALQHRIREREMLKKTLQERLTFLHARKQKLLLQNRK